MSKRLLTLLGETKKPWYLAAGITPIVAYQPIKATSLMASYINIINPGTYDITATTAPTFNAATGWEFNGTDMYLKTGITGLNLTTHTIIICFADWIEKETDTTILGSFTTSAANATIIQQKYSGTTMRTFNGGYVDNGVRVITGTYGIAGKTPYRNGVAETNVIASGDVTTPNELYIGCYNNNGFVAQHAQVKIQSLVIYSSILTAPQYKKVSDAMLSIDGT